MRNTINLLLIILMLSSTALNGTEIAITWPPQQSAFRIDSVIRFKAEIVQGTEPVSEVRFLADSKLIETVKKPPYIINWIIDFIPGKDRWRLEAIAVGEKGVIAEADPVFVRPLTGMPTFSRVRIISPTDESLLPLGPNFQVQAEVLVAPAVTVHKVNFFIGTNLVGQTERHWEDFRPHVLTVTNVVKGDHVIKAEWAGFDQNWNIPDSVNVQVVDLGLQFPANTPDGFQFEGTTAFPGEAIIIEASEDLLEWSPIETILPPNHDFFSRPCESQFLTTLLQGISFTK